MNIISILTIIFIIPILVNSLLRDFIDKKVRYNDVDLTFYGWKHLILFMFFGFTFLLFQNKIKKYRKRYFISHTIEQTKWHLLAFPDNEYYKNKLKEYNNYIRIDKIKRIRKKQRRLIYVR